MFCCLQIGTFAEFPRDERAKGSSWSVENLLGGQKNFFWICELKCCPLPCTKKKNNYCFLSIQIPKWGHSFWMPGREKELHGYRQAPTSCTRQHAWVCLASQKNPLLPKCTPDRGVQRCLSCIFGDGLAQPLELEEMSPAAEDDANYDLQG